MASYGALCVSSVAVPANSSSPRAAFSVALRPAAHRPATAATAAVAAARSRPARPHAARRERHSSSRASRTVTRMGIRAVENFDSTFELQEENKQILVGLLSSSTFCDQVALQPGAPQDAKLEFSGNLFQPVPWSPQTKHGMPQEYESYFFDKDNYVVINVPPNFMFKAKVFKPSRLCAIYRRVADK
eukprot:jgi/Chlat1/5185/Chrsp33S05167